MCLLATIWLPPRWAGVYYDSVWLIMTRHVRMSTLRLPRRMPSGAVAHGREQCRGHAVVVLFEGRVV